MDAIHPMVMRIMMGRARGYSEGGKVANENSGESTDEPTMAKWDGNDFDDLALRDDLESKETGANSGDMDNNSQENRDREDIISKVLKSRPKRTAWLWLVKDLLTAKGNKPDDCQLVRPSKAIETVAQTRRYRV